MTATKCVPSTRAENALYIDIGSIVPPDFDDTIIRRLVEVEAVEELPDLVRMRGIQHVQAQARPASFRSYWRNTSGARLEPPMPSTTASV